MTISEQMQMFCCVAAGLTLQAKPGLARKS
jgi:hypothetical protein